jgi:GNAT superfamily N-acetyltransferase
VKRLWLLNDLFAKEEFRGQGISKLLVERAKELCLETHACGFMLETAKTNLIDNQLYRVMGMTMRENTTITFGV